MARTIVAAAMPAVSWGAILAGGLCAYAFAMLLYLFGAALGVTTMAALNEFRSGVALGTGIWMVVSWVIATYFGGWLAGRLSGRTDRSIGMMYGLIVWALSGVMTLVIGSLTAGSVASAGIQAGASVAEEVGEIGAQLEIPRTLQQNVREALQAQVSRAAGQVQGPGLSEEELRRSIDQLDDRSLKAITRSLIQGDTQEAEAILSEQTELSDEQVRQKEAACKVRMLPARDFEEVIKQALRELGQNKALITSTIKGNARFNQQRLKPLQAEKEQTEHRLITTVQEINRLIKLMKSQDLVGEEITEEYKKLLAERNALETEKEKLQLEIERCSQDMLDAERIAETLLAFDRVIKALSLEDQKELFQLLIKEARVWSFDPAKEKAPREHEAFITKIRTRWYRIKLSLYQFPGIEAYYRSLAQRKASSGITGNWLPGPGGIRTFLAPWAFRPSSSTWLS